MKRRKINLQVELEIDEDVYKTWLDPEEVGSCIEDMVEGSGLMSEVVCKDLGWVEEKEEKSHFHTGSEFQIDDSPIPSSHKSIDDYQSQLKAKKKRRKR